MEMYRKDSKKLAHLLVLSIVFCARFRLFCFLIYPKSSDVPQSFTKYEFYGGMTDELKDSEFFEDLQSGRSICFLGDSITAGTDQRRTLVSATGAIYQRQHL